jgi:hypothetical protein
MFSSKPTTPLTSEDLRHIAAFVAELHDKVDTFNAILTKIIADNHGFRDDIRPGLPHAASVVPTPTPVVAHTTATATPPPLPYPSSSPAPPPAIVVRTSPHHSARTGLHRAAPTGRFSRSGLRRHPYRCDVHADLRTHHPSRVAP